MVGTAKKGEKRGGGAISEWIPKKWLVGKKRDWSRRKKQARFQSKGPKKKTLVGAKNAAKGKKEGGTVKIECGFFTDARKGGTSACRRGGGAIKKRGIFSEVLDGKRSLNGERGGGGAVV